MTQTIYLVAYCSKKLPQTAPAKNLYARQLLQACHKYVEARLGQWYILSAYYGLISPEVVIASYNQSLKDLTSAQLKHTILTTSNMKPESARASGMQVLEQLKVELTKQVVTT